MGHGDQNFTSPVQDRLFEDALIWLGTKAQEPASSAGGRAH